MALLYGSFYFRTHRVDHSCKAAEHQFVFQTLLKSKRPYAGKDYDLSNQLANYWANFIKTGDPNGDGLPAWEEISGSLRVMEFGEQTAMRDDPYAALHAILDEMYGIK